jgi:signal transduction histidine kinase
VSYQSSLLRDTAGAVLGAVEIFTDLTDVKALKEEMQRNKTMAALGEMSATVAHEIRNPLGAMGVWAGLLNRDFEAEDPRRATLKKIIDGLARLNRIVSNLLVYSRPFNAQLRTVRLEDVLVETADFFEIEIERLGQKVVVVKDWKELENVYVSADPEKLQQVIINLSLNAIQAMPDGGTLTVYANASAESNPDFVSFKISDSGAGISEENLAKIFDPFFTTKENGTGLGLAIVKKFIDHHGGFISVDSVPQKGTTFSVFLPRIETKHGET